MTGVNGLRHPPWKIYLRRWSAQWSDGSSRILHAQTAHAAYDLARRLVVPAGVQLQSVEGIR